MANTFAGASANASAAAGRTALLFAFAALAWQPLFAGGTRDAPSAGPADSPRYLGELTVTGTIRRVGSEPFSQLVISDTENRDWYIDRDAQKLSGLEQRNAVVHGRAFVQDLFLANGRKAGVRYLLRDIRLTLNS